MARLTTEDCTDKIPNRFDLVMLAAYRARELSSGKASPDIDIDNDKDPVIALREIAVETQTEEALRDRAITSYQLESAEEEEEEFTEMDRTAMTGGRPNIEFKEHDEISEVNALRAMIKK